MTASSRVAVYLDAIVGAADEKRRTRAIDTFLSEDIDSINRIAYACRNRPGVNWQRDRDEITHEVMIVAAKMIAELGTPKACPAEEWYTRLTVRARSAIAEWADKTFVEGGMGGARQVMRNRRTYATARRNLTELYGRAPTDEEVADFYRQAALRRKNPRKQGVELRPEDVQPRRVESLDQQTHETVGYVASADDCPIDATESVALVAEIINDCRTRYSDAHAEYARIFFVHLGDVTHAQMARHFGFSETTARRYHDTCRAVGYEVLARHGIGPDDWLGRRYDKTGAPPPPADNVELGAARTRTSRSA